LPRRARPCPTSSTVHIDRLGEFVGTAPRSTTAAGDDTDRRSGSPAVPTPRRSDRTPRWKAEQGRGGTGTGCRTGIQRHPEQRLDRCHMRYQLPVPAVVFGAALAATRSKPRRLRGLLRAPASWWYRCCADMRYLVSTRLRTGAETTAVMTTTGIRCDRRRRRPWVSGRRRERGSGRRSWRV